jgi:hypothetical protein
MKHDQHTLEFLYSNILIKENSLDSDLWKTQPEEFYNEPLNNPIDSDDKKESKFDIIIKELENSKASELLLNNLKDLNENEINDLIKKLNNIGNQSREDNMWFLKDNLIKYLFVLSRYNF